MFTNSTLFWVIGGNEKGPARVLETDPLSFNSIYSFTQYIKEQITDTLIQKINFINI